MEGIHSTNYKQDWPTQVLNLEINNKTPDAFLNMWAMGNNIIWYHTFPLLNEKTQSTHTYCSDVEFRVIYILNVVPTHLI